MTNKHDYKEILKEYELASYAYEMWSWYMRNEKTIIHDLKLADKVTGEPSEGMWSGLARDLMMARDLNYNTGGGIRKHLDNLGRDIPDWLDKELKGNVAKGDMCVWIFKAMIDQAQREIAGE